MQRTVLKFADTSVVKRADNLWNVWCVLNASDIGQASAKDAIDAALHNKPHLNPLKWVLVAVAKNKNIGIDEADHWKNSLRNGERPSVRSQLIT